MKKLSKEQRKIIYIMAYDLIAEKEEFLCFAFDKILNQFKEEFDYSRVDHDLLTNCGTIVDADFFLYHFPEMFLCKPDKIDTTWFTNQEYKEYDTKSVRLNILLLAYHL